MAETLFEKVRALDCQTVIENISGAQFKGTFTLCPLPDHNEKTGSLSIDKKRNKWKCFGCNAGGSTIDFVMYYKGVDALEAARILAEYYGIDDSPHGGNARIDRTPVPAIIMHPAANLDTHTEISEAQKKLNADFIRRCAADRRADWYFRKRGFTDETIKRFHLGYDAEKNGIVIPYSDKFEYQITRLMSPFDPKKPYRKPRGKEWGSCPIFGEEAIDNGGVIFIVESQLCAISIAQAGGVAVGLGGLGAIEQLLREIEKRDKKRKCVFIVALDNDDTGKAGQAKIVEQMKILGIRFIEFNVAGEVKDPNELLQTNADALTANVKVAIEWANRRKSNVL